LPDFSGDKLYLEIKAINNQVPVVAISGQEEITVAVNLLKMGVADYLTKDNNTKELLWKTVSRIRETGKLKKEVAYLKEELSQKFCFDKSIKGQSESLQKIFALMKKAAASNINVSITGETGTGKEVVAKAIHYNSERKRKNFIAVNMAAIPGDLIESELFGHEKGAFTGALVRREGKFEEANGGTIFLDEIAELDLSLQSKLLRVLQEREVVRVGGNEIVKLDVRVIVATHKNLADEVKKGNFKEDLYYRVLGLSLQLPPLRERGNDVLILAKHFLHEFNHENGIGSISISQDAKEKLLRYNYPGNIRELKAVIELAAVMCNGKEIHENDISFPSAKSDNIFVTEEKSLEQYNYDIIKFYLGKYSNDIAAVAGKLEIGKSTIYKMIQRKAILL
jgi:DNA-binding NtrC family response regulator